MSMLLLASHYQEGLVRGPCSCSQYGVADAVQAAWSALPADAPKVRLKPAHEVFHQIMHDDTLQQAVGGLDAVIVGYHDRFLGVLEVPLLEFRELDIPFHRVRHYRADECQLCLGLMWHREGRVNNMSVMRDAFLSFYAG